MKPSPTTSVASQSSLWRMFRLERKHVLTFVGVAILFLSGSNVYLARFAATSPDQVQTRPQRPALADSAPRSREDDDSADNNGLTIPLRHFVPSHRACLDPATGQPRAGILHIRMGDIGGAASTIFFQFVIDQILYAERHNLVPWIHFNNISHIVYDPLVHKTKTKGAASSFQVLVGRNATWLHRSSAKHNRHWRDRYPGPINLTQKLSPATIHLVDGRSDDATAISGTDGIWGHYFEPIHPHFVPGDESCEGLPLITLDLKAITPGLHGFAPYTPKCWRYKYLPDYVTQPHVPITEWLSPMREVAHRVISQYGIRLRPFIQKRADNVTKLCGRPKPKATVQDDAQYGNPTTLHYQCLGLHIRHSDKAAGRRIVLTSEFLPYAQAFLNAGGDFVFIATDSAQVLAEIYDTWPHDMTANGQRLLHLGPDTIRSHDNQAVFDITTSHHRTNVEVLTDIAALSNCQYMIHGFSAVSESAIWIHFSRFRNRVVNLEDPYRLSAAKFGTLVQMSIRNEPPANYPYPEQTNSWWRLKDTDSAGLPVSASVNVSGACHGYEGVLLIQHVSKDAEAAEAFFISILNQCLYADKYKLIPWIHLLPPGVNGSTSEFIFDESLHGGTDTKTKFIFHPAVSLSVEEIPLPEVSPRAFTLSKPRATNLESSKLNPRSGRQEITLFGNGVWGSYFEPSTAFSPDDPSCKILPVVSLSERMVSLGLRLYTDWSVKAWRYDDLPSSLWWQPRQKNPTGQSRPPANIRDWYRPMRRSAHALTTKYFRFRPYIIRRADEVNPTRPVSQDNKPFSCLAAHMRNGDKSGLHRQKVKIETFLPYFEAYVRAGGKTIYIASDSHRAIQYIRNNFPTIVVEKVRTQGDFVVRSQKEMQEENFRRTSSIRMIESTARFW
jgi:hypothetical protein